MKIVCISDTHEQHHKLGKLPDGDVLIHAGDLTGAGKYPALMAAADWLRSQPHEYKIVIAGNHDWDLERNPEGAKDIFFDLIYLNQTAHMVKGLKVYGTPWSPSFNDWAFNATAVQATHHAEAIPGDTNILVTHGPPHGIGDRCEDGRRVGCPRLMERILEIKPKLVVTGHIHEDYGIFGIQGITVVNASVLNAGYKLKNKPVVINI